LSRNYRQLHLRDGTIHRHGPRSASCSGSNQLSLNVVSQPLAASASPSLSATDGSFTSSPLSGTRMGSTGIWSPADCPLIKHIPKSAHSACASDLSSIYVRFRLNLNLSQPGWICSTVAIPYCSPQKEGETSQLGFYCQETQLCIFGRGVPQ